MKVKTPRLVIMALFASSFCLAGVHSGLKEAIDNNDIKKAETLVKKMGVSDIYCPATLSWTDAQKIYGNYFIENPKKMGTKCDAEFVAAYDKIACTSKNEIPLCMERMRAVPVSEWQVYLDRIQKNKLHVGAESYKASETTKEKMTSSEKRECTGAIKAQKMLITQYENELQKGLSQDENFASSAAGVKLQYSADSLKEIVAKNEKNCRAGVKEVEKTVTKTISRNLLAPALHVLYKYLEGVINKPFEFNEKNRYLLASYLLLVGNDSEFPSEDSYIEKIKEAYSNTADVEDGLILESCRLYPRIDKKLQNQVELDLFSCEKTLEKYNVDCNQWSKELKIEVTPSVNGTNVISYRCNGINWVTLSAMEYELGPCDKERKNSRKIHEGNYYGCNGKEWTQLPSEIEYLTYGKPCDKSTENKTIKNVKKNTALVCKAGKWRFRMIDKNQVLVQSRQIGNHVWNVENVDVNIPNSFCPAQTGNEKHCQEYSRLYYYGEARNVCPTGWRLPTMDDVYDLNDAMASRAQASKNHFGKYPGAFRDNQGNDKQSMTINYFWLKGDEESLLAGKVFVVDSAESAMPIAVEESSWGLPVRCIRE